MTPQFWRGLIMALILSAPLWFLIALLLWELS